MLRKLDDKSAIATTLANRGVILQHLGKTKEALTSLEESLILNRESGNKVGLVNVLNNLGAFYLSKRELKESFKCFEERKLTYSLTDELSYESALIYKPI